MLNILSQNENVRKDVHDNRLIQENLCIAMSMRFRGYMHMNPTKSLACVLKIFQ